MYSTKKLFIILISIFTIFFLSTYSNADFTITDSVNLSMVNTNLSLINSSISIASSNLSLINSSINSGNLTLSTINTSINSLKTDITSIYTKLNEQINYLISIEADTEQISNDVNELLTLAYDLNDKLDTVNYHLLQISSSVDLIYGAIVSGNEQTHNDITAGNDIQQETQNFVKDDTVQDSTMDISTDDYSADDGELATVDNFYISMLETLQQSINGGVSSIVVPLPTGDNLTITSDIVSSHIQGTALYNLIQACWYFVFGSYMIIAFKRLYVFWANGDFDKNGMSGLSYYLDNANTLIHFWEV